MYNNGRLETVLCTKYVNTHREGHSLFLTVYFKNQYTTEASIVRWR